MTTTQGRWKHARINEVHDSEGRQVGYFNGQGTSIGQDVANAKLDVANAKLAANAPEMLELLRDAREFIGNLPRTGEGLELYGKIKETIKQFEPEPKLTRVDLGTLRTNVLAVIDRLERPFLPASPSQVKETVSRVFANAQSAGGSGRD